MKLIHKLAPLSLFLIACIVMGVVSNVYGLSTSLDTLKATDLWYITPLVLSLTYTSLLILYHNKKRTK